MTLRGWAQSKLPRMLAYWGDGTAAPASFSERFRPFRTGERPTIATETGREAVRVGAMIRETVTYVYSFDQGLVRMMPEEAQEWIEEYLPPQVLFGFAANNLREITSAAADEMSDMQAVRPTPTGPGSLYHELGIFMIEAGDTIRFRVGGRGTRPLNVADPPISRIASNFLPGTGTEVITLPVIGMDYVRTTVRFRRRLSNPAARSRGNNRWYSIAREPIVMRVKALMLGRPSRGVDSTSVVEEEAMGIPAAPFHDPTFGWTANGTIRFLRTSVTGYREYCATAREMIAAGSAEAVAYGPIPRSQCEPESTNIIATNSNHIRDGLVPDWNWANERFWLDQVVLGISSIRMHGDDVCFGTRDPIAGVRHASIFHVAVGMSMISDPAYLRNLLNPWRPVWAEFYRAKYAMDVYERGYRMDPFDHLIAFSLRRWLRTPSRPIEDGSPHSLLRMLQKLSAAELLCERTVLGPNSVTASRARAAAEQLRQLQARRRVVDIDASLGGDASLISSDVVDAGGADAGGADATLRHPNLDWFGDRPVSERRAMWEAAALMEQGPVAAAAAANLLRTVNWRYWEEPVL
jgi:hypothetical protein